jgi:hypothetical protein
MDRVRAKNWYFWLWASPLLTIPTLGIILLIQPGYGLTLPILASALWHLILLIPALNTQAPFVRWHGRQAMLLAGARTAVALAFGPILEQWALAVLALIVVWSVGTLWGHRQAARGDCSMMRWAGHGEELYDLQRADQEAKAELEELRLDRLLDIVRFSRDPTRRESAVSELERQGMVDPL